MSAASHAGLGLSDLGTVLLRGATWADAFLTYFPGCCRYDPDNPDTVLVSSVYEVHKKCIEVSYRMHRGAEEVDELEAKVLALKARVYQLQDRLGDSPSMLRADVSSVILDDAADPRDTEESSEQEVL